MGDNSYSEYLVDSEESEESYESPNSGKWKIS